MAFFFIFIFNPVGAEVGHPPRPHLHRGGPADDGRPLPKLSPSLHRPLRRPPGPPPRPAGRPPRHRLHPHPLRDPGRRKEALRAKEDRPRPPRLPRPPPPRPGGGIIFGPKPNDWSIKMNRKEKRLAISSAIVNEDALVVVEDGFAEEFGKMGRPMTREFVEAMRRWSLDPKDKATFLTMEVPDNVRLSCRNIGTVKMLTPRTLNLFNILDAEKLVFTKMAAGYLNAMYGENAYFDNEDDDDDEEIEKGNCLLGA